MSEELRHYLIEYVEARIGVYSTYLTEILTKGLIMLLVSFEGTTMGFGSDYENLEFLRKAGLLERKVKWGERNEYYIYTLTDQGHKIGERLRNEGTTETVKKLDTL
jgi:predicted transcriptional regulator with HTH domain